MTNKDTSGSLDSKDRAEQILGLDPPYSQEQAQQAYRAAIAANHPDLAEANGVDKDEAAQNMIAVNEAWKILKTDGFHEEAFFHDQDQMTEATYADDLDPIPSDFKNVEHASWADLKEAFPVLKLAALVLKIMCVLALLSVILGLTYRFYA